MWPSHGSAAVVGGVAETPAIKLAGVGLVGAKSPDWPVRADSSCLSQLSGGGVPSVGTVMAFPPAPSPASGNHYASLWHSPGAPGLCHVTSSAPAPSSTSPPPLACPRNRRAAPAAVAFAAKGRRGAEEPTYHRTSGPRRPAAKEARLRRTFVGQAVTRREYSVHSTSTSV